MGGPKIESPDYYTGFTDGAQPIDITEHLTGNAAQAIQLLTRACRVDGVKKSDPIEDVEKAIWFAQRELARLERERDSRTITSAYDASKPYTLTFKATGLNDTEVMKTLYGATIAPTAD